MKKIVLAAAALVMCSAATLSAQPFEWGLKGGLGLPSIYKVDDADMKVSFYVGAFANFRIIDDLLDIQPELVYSRQGFKDGDFYARFNYINIPVLAKLHIIDKLTLDLGPQFGIMLNNRYKTEEGGTTFKGDFEDLGADVKNFDVSFAMGLSYRIIPKMDISARYNLGLTKVFSADGEDGKNSVFQLGVGYWFR